MVSPAQPSPPTRAHVLLYDLGRVLFENGRVIGAAARRTHSPALAARLRQIFLDRLSAHLPLWRVVTGAGLDPGIEGAGPRGFYNLKHLSARVMVERPTAGGDAELLALLFRLDAALVAELAFVVKVAAELPPELREAVLQVEARFVPLDRADLTARACPPAPLPRSRTGWLGLDAGWRRLAGWLGGRALSSTDARERPLSPRET